MKLNIDGREVQARAGESLLDMITKMGLRTGNLSDEPLAAKIAGDVFTLNYIPLREKDVLPDRESKRRAMAASGGKIRLLRYADAQGRAAYTRTAQFVLFLAIHELWRGARATMRCTLGTGLYIKVTGADRFSVRDKVYLQGEQAYLRLTPQIRAALFLHNKQNHVYLMRQYISF